MTIPATDFLTGFEAGLISTNGGNTSQRADALASATALSSIISSGQRSGTYCAQVAPTGAAAGNIRFQCIQTASRIRVWRLGLKVPTLPASGSVVVFQAHLSTTLRVALRVSSTGLIEGSLDGTTWVGSTTLSSPTTTWHLIELQLDYTTTTNALNWKVDGVTQTGTTGTSTTTAPSLMTLGSTVTTGPAATIQYDDVITGLTTSSADWYGDGEILALAPGSDGTHSMTANDFTVGDAGANITNATTTAWQSLDDLPWSATRSTTVAIRQAVLRATSYVEVKPATADSSKPAANAVRAMLAYSATATTADTGGAIVRNSAGTVGVIWGDLPTAQGGGNGALADYSESSNFFKMVMVAAPGAGWTNTEIDAIRFRIGGSDDVTPFPTWQRLLLEVDYPLSSTTPVGKTTVFVWNVRAPVGPTVIAKWNVRAAVGKTLIALWNVKTFVGLTRVYLWKVATSVGKTTIAKWNLRAPVGPTTVLKWNVRAPVGKTTIVKWNVRARIRQANLLSANQAGIETSAAGWTSSYNPGGLSFTMTQASDQVHGGSFSLKTAWSTGTGASQFNININPNASIAVKPGDMTSAGVWVRVNRAQTVTCNIDYFNSGPSYIVSHFKSFALPADTWVFISAGSPDGGAPAGSAWMGLTVSASPQAGDVLWLDDADMWLTGVGLIAPWNIRSSVGLSRIYLWQVRAPVGKTTIALWNVRAAVAQTMIFRWAVKTTVGKQIVALWNVRAAVGKTLTAPWNVRAAVAKITTALWRVRAAVGSTAILRWNVRAAVGKTSILLWHVRARVGLTRIAIWNVRERVGLTRTYLWNVAVLSGGLTAVGKTLIVIWNVRQPVSKVDVLNWNVRATVPKTTIVKWNVRAAVSKIVTALWNVRSSVGKTTTLRWNVRAAVGVARVYLWNVRAAVGQTRIVKWNVRAVVGLTRIARWNVRAAISQTLTARWNVKTFVGRTLTAVWNVLSTVPSFGIFDFSPNRATSSEEGDSNGTVLMEGSGQASSSTDSDPSASSLDEGDEAVSSSDDADSSFAYVFIE